jgi:hypothetical protein
MLFPYVRVKLYSILNILTADWITAVLLAKEVSGNELHCTSGQTEVSDRVEIKPRLATASHVLLINNTRS